MAKIDTDQTIEIDIVDHHIEVDHSMCNYTENGHSMSKIIEETLRKEILEKHKTIEVNILEVYTEVSLEIIILIEVAVGLEKDNFWVILE